MRFSTVAFMAGSALASEAPVSTDYATHLITVTACPSDVANCPSRSMTSSVITSIVSAPTSTAYSTKVHTITSCAPDVTDCPGRSTAMSTETMTASTPSVPVGPPSSIIYPSPGNNNKTMGIPPIVPSQPASQPPVSGNPPAPTNTETEAPVETETPDETEAPGCEGSTVTAITKSYTTVLTSVEYSTIQAPCATGVPPELPTGKLPVPTPGVPSPPGNSTIPPSPPTSGASSMAGSALLAAAAGFVAVMFA